jgi:hypothetical protein
MKRLAPCVNTPECFNNQSEVNKADKTSHQVSLLKREDAPKAF